MFVNTAMVSHDAHQEKYEEFPLTPRSWTKAAVKQIATFWMT
jgi:hypothetical protein